MVGIIPICEAKMKNYDDEEFRMDGYYDMERDEYEDVADNDVVDLAQIDLLDKKLNQSLLDSVISLLSKSFFWKFRPLDSKLEIIENTYKKFRSLVEHTGIEEE